VDELSDQFPFKENTPPVVFVGMLLITSQLVIEAEIINRPKAIETIFLMILILYKLQVYNCARVKV
jgi:hypothetical protein